MENDLYPKASLEEAFPGSLMASYYGTNVVFSNGDVWKRHRFITNPAFKSMPMQLFDEITVKLLKVVEKVDNEPTHRARKKAANMNNLFNGLIEKKRKSMETDELNEEMRHNLAIFMLAGHETTATVLTTVLYVLATHKDIQSKVREELLCVLGDNLIPTTEQQRELKYMNMVLHENLRLYPPVHQLPRRENSEIINFRNHTFLSKISIIVNIYGIHHSPKYWKNPEEFIPERFENEHDEK
ncbi:902_t:CDS:10 [Funneliformis geosporum]|nr:902_t:CDS:10 [Funneliformis geosporum]